jgi:pyruvate dehydrogenase E1 component alpha subunit
MSDPAKYRSKEEVDDVKKNRDPIDHVREMMVMTGISDDSIKAIDNDVKSIVLEAVEFAQTSPEPDPSELYTDVYNEA